LSSLSAKIFEAMSSYKDLGALKIGPRVISYQELLSLSLQVAARLSNVNSAVPPRVGILGQRSLATYTGVLGTLFAGGAYVPLNTKVPPKKLREIVINSGTCFIVATASEWESRRDCFVDTGVTAVLFPETDCAQKYENIELAGCSDLAKLEPLKEPVSSRAETLVYVLFTSGSTGKPKGVTVTGANVLALMQALGRYYDLKPGYRSSQTFDLSFDPSVCDMFFTWSKGGLLCVLPQEELMCPWDYIRREQIEFWHCVPALASIMLKLKMLNAGDFPALKYSIFTGEPLRKDIALAWQRSAPQSTVENRYGPTEATVDVTRFVLAPKDFERDFSNGILPIGKPHPGTMIQIIDDANTICPAGNIGEIVLGGPQVAQGYLNDPEKTAGAFVKFPWDATQAPWYRTGDLGFVNADGNIECLGRRDSQIKIAGRRVEIGEIEGALLKAGVLKEVVVVPVRDQNLSVLELVAWTESELTKNQILDLKQKCRDSLEDVFFPKRFAACGQIPLTPSGKIDRKLLEARAARTEPGSPPESPSTT